MEFTNRKNFEGMESLKMLDLRRNKLATLPDEVFLDLRKLRKIDLTGNFIKVLPNMAFHSMFYLTSFIANENLIELFDSDIFINNQKLNEIHLWRNQIRAIRFDSKKFTNLVVIDLRGNVCIDDMFYFTFDLPPYPILQKQINGKCSSYVKQQGQLIFRGSRTYRRH